MSELIYSILSAALVFKNASEFYSRKSYRKCPTVQPSDLGTSLFLIYKQSFLLPATFSLFVSPFIQLSCSVLHQEWPSMQDILFSVWFFHRSNNASKLFCFQDLTLSVLTFTQGGLHRYSTESNSVWRIHSSLL